MKEIYQDIAAEHGVSVSTVEALAQALAQGNGRMAQFNIPELGGMGQWMAGGMTMVGDMNNHTLKVVVNNICHDILAAIIDAPTQQAPLSTMQKFVWDNVAATSVWWPADLGSPSSTGKQNEMEYAYFKAENCLAIKLGNAITVYDTTGYDISGVSQQQSNNRTVVIFNSQRGVVNVAQLKVVSSNT